ncbi:helix-turn-helix transcriptional regulator [Comamonas sp. CMM01]|uniref:helix-turn-helix domain-containing protein n=1 Tax=Comamonas sp. CMM01 TaxID=2769280 RepID=UPI00177F7A32|nr:helix-turn-helix transcriptional regulator [Comamonas sp. CMM01]MBD9530941.1 helix-turn-helix transcriptional regulator [Comamonas sp. CMM01]
MPIGDRLREERDRLGLSQPNFAALAGTTKQTLFSWETGKTAPDGFQLAAFAAAGVDVLYVITGERGGSHLAHDAAEQVLLDSYRRCKPEARQNLIQTAALLSAGLPPATAPSGSMVMSNLGDGNVQVGSGAQVSVKRSK